MPAIAVYVRVSTTGQNIDGQRREIERWLKGNMGDGEEVRSYIDKASANNRPACIVAAVSTTSAVLHVVSPISATPVGKPKSHRLPRCPEPNWNGEGGSCVCGDAPAADAD